jgi:hypothetical protein
MHLDGGVAVDGTRILSEAAVGAMQEPQVAVPDRWTLGDHWGLGWILFTWAGKPLYGHDGGTIGQAAFLRVVPEAGVAVALLTNGGHASDLYQELYQELLREVADVSMPARPEPPDSPVTVDPSTFAGVYERSSSRIEITPGDGVLEATTTTTGALAALVPDPVQKFTLIPVDPAQRLFVTRLEGMETWTPAVFFTLDDGSQYIHFGARATPKVG